MAKPKLEVWDAELVVHEPKKDGQTTFECRALIQAKDQDGNQWYGDRIIRIKMRRQP